MERRVPDREKCVQARPDPWIALLLVLALPILVAAQPRAHPRPRVAAAADLRPALEEIAADWLAGGKPPIDLVFGSSGVLTRQILDGAPFDLFLSADETFVFQLADAGLTRDRGLVYGVGRLALFARHDSPLALDPRMDGVRALLAADPRAKFALANPEHAPYGRAAEAALRTHGLWEAVAPRLVLGENVAQAAQFAASGNAAGGLIAYALALSPALRAQGRFVLIAESDHPPLRQRMVLLRRAGPDAVGFHHHLQTPAARAVLERYGFVVPAS
jgi:molybdate transport system substrate-binding protein